LAITVFSAPNYCDRYENSSAYLRVTDVYYDFKQLTWQEHPYVFPDFANGFKLSLPFVAENVVKLFIDIAEAIFAELDDERKQEYLKKFVRSAGRAMIKSRQLKREFLEQTQPFDLESLMQASFYGDPNAPGSPGRRSLKRRAMSDNEYLRLRKRFETAKQKDKDNEGFHKQGAENEVAPSETASPKGRTRRFQRINTVGHFQSSKTNKSEKLQF